MTEKEAIKNTVLEIALENIEFETEVSGGDLVAMLKEDLAEHLDSIKLFSLIVAIEDHYQICLEPEDDEAISSLDDVVNTIARLLNKNEAE